MASGLETRVPYCDHRLVEYVYNAPWEFKTFDGREKSLLRAAWGDVVPRSVLDRPKSPYPITQDPTYTQALHREFAAVLADPNSPVLPLLDLDVARLAIKDATGPAHAWHNRGHIEMALGFNFWMQHYGVRIEL
jgi:asparagine synthase (glutamine-hydrolysing)